MPAIRLFYPSPFIISSAFERSRSIDFKALISNADGEIDAILKVSNVGS